MAEVTCDHDSNGDDEVMALRLPNPPPKRRRIRNPSAITSVPVSSTKPTRRRKLKPAVFKRVDCTEVSEEEEGEEEEVRLWTPSLPKNKKNLFSTNLSDSVERLRPRLASRAPYSPPPPCTPPVLKKTCAGKRIIKHKRKLDAFSSLTCSTPERHEDIVDVSEVNDCNNDDDIIIISSESKQKRFSAKPKPGKCAQEISLKLRWRLDVHKIAVLSTDPLSKAIAQLSVKLKVPPTNILLMRNDEELPVHSTVTQLDLGNADIIDCVVLTDNKEDESGSDVITVRLQGKEKGSAQEYSVRMNSPLGSVLSQYASRLSAAARRKVKFLFDGLKVALNQTPSQLDMEDGDVIDVWT